MLATATVSVPATSANLGPGFDSLGVALELRDVVTATLSDVAGIRVEISGEGSDSLPNDEKHLVAAVLLKALEKLGIETVGLDITCTNSIPQGKGLGSSAAAIVAGLALAQAIALDGHVDLDWVFAQAADYEGHPDNAAACVYGGLTVAWTNEASHSRSLEILPSIHAVVGIPASELLTEKARGLLPESVPHADAAFNAARSALLIVGLTQDASVLVEATDDRLHQNYRAQAFPDSIAAVSAMRAAKIPACVSGAGPAVLAFATEDQISNSQEILANHGFSAQSLAFATTGLQIS
jgi:homoserine kinase